MKKALRLIAVILTMALLTACAPQGKTQDDEPPIKIALTQDMLSFDPILTTDIFSEAVLRCVYTSLFDFDEELNLRLKLAKSIEVIDDYTWLIEIHDNVKFTDGSLLTTDDVVFTIQRALTGERTKKLLEMVKEAEKIDDTHFYLKSKEPYSDLPSLFAKAETSILSKKAVQADGYDFTVPVGAGPFKLLKREDGKLISLERNDEYFLNKAQQKYLDFVIMVTEQERTAAFLNGEVDMLFSVSAYDSDKIKLSQDKRLYSSASTKIEYLSLNNTHPPLDNPTLRLAINYAINREAIAKNVYHGYSVSSASLIPEGVIGYVPNQIEYSPEKAAELLKQAGLEQGVEFTVIAIDTIRKNTLEYIKLDLAKVGITLNYELVTMKQAVEKMNNNEHDAILVGWAFSSDPNGVLPLVLGSNSGKTMNSSRYNNPLIDDMFTQARSEQSRDKKRQIYEEINKIVVQESPIIILQNPKVLCAADNSIEGVSLNPQGLFQYEKLSISR